MGRSDKENGGFVCKPAKLSENEMEYFTNMNASCASRHITPHPVRTASAGEIPADAVLLHAAPECRFADAEGIGNSLPIAAVLLQDRCKLDRLGVLDDHLLSGIGGKARRHLCELPLEEHFIDGAALCGQDNPLAEAAELIEIAGPGVSVQVFPGALRQSEVSLMPLLCFVHNRIYPGKNVIAALPKRRIMEGQHVQSVIQIRAEAPCSTRERSWVLVEARMRMSAVTGR